MLTVDKMEVFAFSKSSLVLDPTTNTTSRRLDERAVKVERI